MAAKKPGLISVAGEKYRATVIRVFDKDKDGRACQCMIVHDDATIKISDGDQFIIAFVPVHALAKR